MKRKIKEEKNIAGHWQIISTEPFFEFGDAYRKAKYIGLSTWLIMVIKICKNSQDMITYKLEAHLLGRTFGVKGGGA